MREALPAVVVVVALARRVALRSDVLLAVHCIEMLPALDKVKPKTEILVPVAGAAIETWFAIKLGCKVVSRPDGPRIAGIIRPVPETKRLFE